MREFLLKDPVWSQQFASVDLIEGRDYGVDLEAKSHDGKATWAIQCKFHSPETRINKGDIDSFLAELGKTRYTHGMIIDTGASWGKTAARAIRNLNKPVKLLRFLELVNSDVDWPDLSGDLSGLQVRVGTFELMPHQVTAVEKVIAGFEGSNRGKLIMACGTGKTFAALRIAERMVGTGGTCLYMVPSIALMQQTLREWANQKRIPHSYVGICSDVRAGRLAEDIDVFELELPVTTDLEMIATALSASPGDSMRVVFCTYQSIELIVEAQKNSQSEDFDLVICDEAHRTTGVEKPGDDLSPFVQVHDSALVQAKKRLYMTATPRLYTEASKKKAADKSVDIFSMDDDEVFGPEFHRLDFGQAVDLGLLSDYKVLVLHISQNLAARLVTKGFDTAEGADWDPKLKRLTVDDAARIAGCWTGLLDPEKAAPASDYRELQFPKLKRAIAFNSRIRTSKTIQDYFGLVANAVTPDRIGQIEVRHVDGTDNALNRVRELDWLREGSESQCRILTNAQCLSEGVDVPALDAVLFMNPRRSHVDIVQAVGRVMRKSEGKDFGYILLPVVVGATQDLGDVIDSTGYQTVWEVLRALRSHDGRLDVEINQIDLNKRLPPKIRVVGVDEDPDDEFVVVDTEIGMEQLRFGVLPDAIYAAIVDKVGDRQYWDKWARDIGEIAASIATRIRTLRRNSRAVGTEFDRFVAELRVATNDSLDEGEVESMLSQHLITKPVFEALFADSEFMLRNPVSRAMESMLDLLNSNGLGAEIEQFEGFYRSVENRVIGITDAAGKQTVLKELYEKFFKTAFKKTTDQLGIVYTPNEIVDFMIRSTDFILRTRFSTSGISDKDVHVLEPFAGTGTFLTNLIESVDVVPGEALLRKYNNELHANEILPLAYYVGALNIERALQGRLKLRDYMPFNGMVLTDTFRLNEGERSQRRFSRSYFGENDERAESQEQTEIQVFLSNPPWSARQADARDGNPNVVYPSVDSRIADTYVKKSGATQRASLYDSYVRAIRWATDRLDERGIIGFVTNNGWLDGRAAAGIRACLANEFNEIYVYNLKGNARTAGEAWRREGGKVFGQGSRAGVCIIFLIRSSEFSQDESARIWYASVDDYLSTDQKLASLSDFGSIDGVPGWQSIEPDQNSDWLNQRNLRFATYLPMGDPLVKRGIGTDSIFQLFGRGLATSRDEYAYSFDKNELIDRTRSMIKYYNSCLGMDPPPPRDNLIKWHHDSSAAVAKGKKANWDESSILIAQYRPFVKQFVHFHSTFNSRHYQLPAMFPDPLVRNDVIAVSGKGGNRQFSALASKGLVDLQCVENCQLFPRWRFSPRTAEPLLDAHQGPISASEQAELFARVDNITDWALLEFQRVYRDSSIDKESIFNYVYGLLHHRGFAEQFANDLSKDLPRIPFAPDFWTVSQIGSQLAELHIDYEALRPFPLTVSRPYDFDPKSKLHTHCEKLTWVKGSNKSELAFNDYVTISGIPKSAHEYTVNGQSPLDWMVDRWRIVVHKRSKIKNDPNAWFDQSQNAVDLIAKVTRAAVDSAKLINKLPQEFDKG